MKKTTKVRIRRVPSAFFIALAVVIAITFCSCNVTRTVTTQSQYFTKGDTTCTIVTKTVETYDASKHY